MPVESTPWHELHAACAKPNFFALEEVPCGWHDAQLPSSLWSGFTVEVR